MRKREAIASSEQRVIQVLLWALKPLSNLRRCRSIPLPYAMIFLSVALEEGKPVGTYARELGLTRFVMSRYMRRIGDRARDGGPGLGLVTVKRIASYQIRTEVYLTNKGRALAKEVFENLRRLQTIEEVGAKAQGQRRESADNFHQ